MGQFARLTWRGVKTLQKWDRGGILNAHRSPTGRRYYTHDQYLDCQGLKATGAGTTMAYARVSTVAQKPDVQHQVAVLRAYCHVQGITNLSAEQEFVQDLLAIMQVF